MLDNAQKYIWEGAIPLQIHLHESEVTTLPPPPPAMILAHRIGYLPLLIPQIKPFFSSTLPPGEDTVWFEYKGLPLKWYIPTGVLFDLLCAEPERPWNLTVHFRGYPSNILTPCESEDNVKWGFINSLKEAAYIINGNSKNVMNMSQSDQTELWSSILNNKLEKYLPISSKLKLGLIKDDYSLKLKTSDGDGDGDVVAPTKADKVPVRLYVRIIDKEFNDLEDVPSVDNWEKVSYINKPVEVSGNGKSFTLYDAVKSLLPELFTEKNENTDKAEIKLIRIQGIEPKMEIPFAWVASNLMNPEYYLHICVYVKVVEKVSL